MPPSRTTKKTIHHAYHLRHSLSEAESKLWSHLRAHRLNNIHFRRQFAIGKFIVDFCAPRQKLIIEVDGSQHLDREEQDQERSAYLSVKGYRVLRFWNHDVMNNIDGVIIMIQQTISETDSNT